MMTMTTLQHRLYLSLHWFQLPVIILVGLLQRTPILRLLVNGDLLAGQGTVGFVLRSSAVLAVMTHGVDTLVGATTVNTMPADPASATVGTQFDATFGVTGAPSTVASYTINGIPPGLTVTGSTALAADLLINSSTGAITGVPTTAGTYNVTITAWKRTNATGPDFIFTYTINVSAASGGPAAPAITSPPASLTVSAGQSVTFSVTASGTAPLSYQWKKDGASIGGATGATHTIATAAASDAGNYTVVVTNAAGNATSPAATLIVNTPAAATAPAITTLPASQTVTAGQSVTFSVSATGSAPLTYQWKKDGAVLFGATNATYSIAAAATGDTGSYTVVVTNTVGSATSTAATLTVNAVPAGSTAPSIATQPLSQSVTAGQSVSFSVTASGTAPLSYQWQKDGANLAGATGASYSIAAASTGDTGSYAVVVTNAGGNVISASATLTVNAAASGGTTPSPGTSAQVPSISSHPANLSVGAGQSGSFLIVATGGSGLAYQWQVSTNNGSTWQNLVNDATYNGTFSSTLNVNSILPAMNGNLYRVVATNTAGTATSDSAMLIMAGSLLSRPAALAVDESGNVYVCDSASNVIQRINGAGTIALWAGSRGQAGSGDGLNAFFNQPSGIVSATGGVIYVADTANATIRRIAANGSVTTLAGSAASRGSADGSAATFSAPIGLALDAAGNLYVADSTNHIIRKIAPSGAVSTLAGLAGTSGFRDGTGSAARFNLPSGIACDSSGNLYVADTNNNLIRRITPAGVVSTLAGVAGVSGSDNGNGANALFNQPQGLAMSKSGYLYVADAGNSSVRRVTSSGSVTTIAGLPSISGNMDSGDDDDDNKLAWFNHPLAVACDANNYIYVADTGNGTVRRISPDGKVNTLSLSIAEVKVPGSTTTNAISTGGTSSSSSSATLASAGGSSAGGGAVSPWSLLSFGVLALLRRFFRR